MITSPLLANSPPCADRQNSSYPLQSASLRMMMPAVCACGNADISRTGPDWRGSVSRTARTAANRLWWECTTAAGMRVVPDECVMATGSSGWCR